ncbi:hypothetical protein PO124_03070 [Bacillus licheniformis]|nr:hypothetical protein [Bacillus licheniformis]
MKAVIEARKPLPYRADKYSATAMTSMVSKRYADGNEQRRQHDEPCHRRIKEAFLFSFLPSIPLKSE